MLFKQIIINKLDKLAEAFNSRGSQIARIAKDVEDTKKLLEKIEKDLEKHLAADDKKSRTKRSE